MGNLGRPPQSAYKEEDWAPVERRVWARKIQPRRGEEQCGAHEAGGEQ